MSWYRTGTVTLTGGSKNVTGTGTAFIKNVVPGFGFIGPDLQLYEVEAVTSDTAATLKTPYSGATVAGAAYAIFQTQGMIAELSRQVAELIATFGPLRTIEDFLAYVAEARASQNAAAASAAAAASSETSAAASKNAAGASEANALASKNAAATSATAALASENAAGTSATNAGTSAAGALASKNAAATSETNAAGSASSAAASAASVNAANLLTKAGNLAGLADPAAARANLNLGNVNNTADASKPVSTAQAAAIAARYGKDNILGTVSQTSGVPTGALMEHGTNANGEYWRYAGGLQICIRTLFQGAVSMSANGSCFISSSTQGGGALPAAFATGSTPDYKSFIHCDQGTAWLTGAVPANPTNFQQTYLMAPSATTLTNTLIAMQATGRWF